MAWNDNIENIKFTITTGDGKSFFPLWRESAKNTEFNTTGFDFIDVPGTLYERKQYRGSNYPLQFFFDGSDCLDVALEFEISARDKRPWTVLHPMYGSIKGQPTSLGRVDSLNFVAINVDFWESIDVDYPNSNFSVKDNTLFKKTNVLDSCAESFSNKPVFAPEDIVSSKDTVKQFSASIEPVITSNPLYADSLYTEYQYTNAVALKASDNLLTDAFGYITATQALLNLPSRIDTSITVRLNGYKSAYSKIKGILDTIADKLGFESHGGAIIANYADAAVNPTDTDYTTMPEVQQAATDLIVMYNDYVSTLDNASVGIYDTENTYQPDPTVQTQIYDLVMYTVANLYETAFNAQQERVVYTDSDTNIILLVHRYLGMDVADENIDRFRLINNIKLNELFNIKKDRRIIYYV